MAPSEGAICLCVPDVLIEFFYRTYGRDSGIHDGVEDLRGGFAKVFCRSQDFASDRRRHLAQTLGLAGSEQHGLCREAQQVVVAFEEFFGAGLAEAPVERVDEIEDGMAGDELKGFRHFFCG